MNDYRDWYISMQWNIIWQYVTRNEVLVHATVQINLENIVSVKKDKQSAILDDSIYIKCSEYATR